MMAEPKGNPQKKESAVVPTLGALENVAKSFFRQADGKRAKRLGKPFKDRYPQRKEVLVGPGGS